MSPRACMWDTQVSKEAVQRQTPLWTASSHSGVLQDKLRHIKMTKHLFEPTSIPDGPHQSGSDKENSTDRSWGKTFLEERQKQNQEII